MPGTPASPESWIPSSSESRKTVSPKDATGGVNTPHSPSSAVAIPSIINIISEALGFGFVIKLPFVLMPIPTLVGCEQDV